MSTKRYCSYCLKVHSPFQSSFIWWRKWVTSSSALNLRARTGSCSDSDEYWAGVRQQLWDTKESWSLQMAWPDSGLPFTRANFQNVTSSILSLQDSHPQWQKCAQLVCRRLGGGITKLNYVPHRTRGFGGTCFFFIPLYQYGSSTMRIGHGKR